MTSQGRIPILIAAPIAFSGCGPQKPASLAPRRPPQKAPAAPEPVRYRLYIPTAEGRLALRIEDNPHLLLTHAARSGPAYEWSEEAATEAIKRLLRAAPEKFPPGTRLVGGISSWSGLPKGNFNGAFANPNWWEKAGPRESGHLRPCRYGRYNQENHLGIVR